MKTQHLNWHAEPGFEIELQPARNPSPCLQLVEARARHRRIRIALPLPRRESCLTKRKMIAALREAELAEWHDRDLPGNLTSGGPQRTL